LSLIYKILPADEWAAAEARGVFEGSAVDLADGFIHFSNAAQAPETAAKWFRGRTGLVLVAFEADVLGPGLKWEPSRGGDLFPHLYGPLPVKLALWVRPLGLDAEGVPALGGLA
jgi:uncharacterized protein (DUF952 family)